MPGSPEVVVFVIAHSSVAACVVSVSFYVLQVLNGLTQVKLRIESGITLSQRQITVPIIRISLLSIRYSASNLAELLRWFVVSIQVI